MHLELGALLHFDIIWLEYLRVVDYLGCTFERLDQLAGPLFELGGKALIECLQLGHVEFEEVIAALRVVSELFPVYVNVVLLRFPDEVHELVLRIVLVDLVLIVLDFVIDQILVRVVDSFTFKTVHVSSEALF